MRRTASLADGRIACPGHAGVTTVARRANKAEDQERSGDAARAACPARPGGPARRMPTRSHRASTSLRMCDEEEHRLAALLGLAYRLAERDLHQRIQAVGRLVEDQQVGAAGERGDQLDPLPVALRERVLVDVELEALDERVAVCGVGARAAFREVGERFGARERGPQKRLAGDIGGPSCAATGSRQASIPSNSARPAVGRCKPKSSRIVVVLPAPLGPRYSIHLASAAPRRARPARACGRSASRALGVDRVTEPTALAVAAQPQPPGVPRLRACHRQPPSPSCADRDRIAPAARPVIGAAPTIRGGELRDRPSVPASRDSADSDAVTGGGHPRPLRSGPTPA